MGIIIHLEYLTLIVQVMIQLKLMMYISLLKNQRYSQEETNMEFNILDKLKSLTKELGPIEKFGYGMPKLGPDLM